jgi:replication fork protection complex subunit Tof1/Swi1
MTDTDQPQWYIPSALLPCDLQNTLGVIRQYISSPIDLDGKKPSTLLRAKTKRRRRRSPSPESDEDSEGSRGRSKKEKRKKEKEVYKSAAIIVDSDEEYGDMDTFLEKERLLRERTERITSEGGRLATMKATGTKKRKLLVSR